MVTIYINNVDWDKVNQQVTFTNWISLKIFGDFFEKAFKGKGEKVKQRYFEFCNENNCIFLPESPEGISFFTRRILKDPKNVLDYPSQFENFIKVIKIEEATLYSIDKKISPMFEKGKTGLDMIYLLNCATELNQYEEIIQGISSPRVSYFESNDKKGQLALLKSTILKAVNCNKNKKEISLMKFWLRIGTTAIKPRS